MTQVNNKRNDNLSPSASVMTKTNSPDLKKAVVAWERLCSIGAEIRSGSMNEIQEMKNKGRR